MRQTIEYTAVMFLIVALMISIYAGRTDDYSLLVMAMIMGGISAPVLFVCVRTA